MSDLEARIAEIGTAIRGESKDSLGRTFPERAWGLVKKSSTCWIWQGTLDAKGYGTMHFNGRFYRMHRAIYQITNGPIPDGLVIDHLCRTHDCVNPDHLEPVTIAENVLRGIGPTAVNRRKTRCKNGHELDQWNTYVDPKRGTRGCRTCRIKTSRDHRNRARALQLQEQR